MKQWIMCVWGVLLMWNASAQDLILLRTAEQIEAVVIEITDTEVLYRPFAGGGDRSVPRADVFSITYRNGQHETFSVQRKGDYPWPHVSRAYRVGELFDEDGVRGLVVATTDAGRHGLLLSLDEGSAFWGGTWGEEWRDSFRAFKCYCHSMKDGWENMQAVAELIAKTSGVSWSNFPAFDWCRGQGEGWYLPAWEEMAVLWNFGSANPAQTLGEHSSAILALNALLEGAGYTRMRRYVYYWTSSEDGKMEHARVWAPKPEKYRFAEKKYSMCVRAVHKF